MHLRGTQIKYSPPGVIDPYHVSTLPRKLTWQAFFSLHAHLKTLFFYARKIQIRRQTRRNTPEKTRRHTRVYFYRTIDNTALLLQLPITIKSLGWIWIWLKQHRVRSVHCLNNRTCHGLLLVFTGNVLFMLMQALSWCFFYSPRKQEAPPQWLAQARIPLMHPVCWPCLFSSSHWCYDLVLLRVAKLTLGVSFSSWYSRIVLMCLTSALLRNLYACWYTNAVDCKLCLTSRDSCIKFLLAPMSLNMFIYMFP